MVKITNILLTFSILTLIGCGSGSNSVIDDKKNSLESLHSINMPNAHNVEVIKAGKIQRANWDGIQPLTDGFFITNDSTLLSFKIQDDRITTDEIISEVIFIDADNNPNTGYRNDNSKNIGAEYLIEGNNIFIYTGEGWSWDIISRVDIDINENEIEAEFNMNLIQNSPTIRAISGLVDSNWAIIGTSDIVNYTISDDNEEDENQNTTSFIIEDDEQNIQFSMNNPLIASEETQTEVIFIDADNNPNTGYTNSRWRSIGAEYLIQGNTIFSYGQDGWDWNLISSINMQRNDENILVTINKNILQLSSNIRTIAGLLDNDWQTTFVYDISDYTLALSNDNNDEIDENTTIVDNRLTIDNNNINITFNIQSENIENNIAVNNIIFIDTDNNLETGYNNIDSWHNNLGAEYLISNNALYSYGGTGWDWNYISNIERVVNTNQINVTVDTNIFDNLAQTFNTTAYLADNDWIVRERFDTTSSDNDIIDHGRILITHDIYTFDITLENNKINTNTNSQLYIDADNDRTSGFSVNGLGAEYRVINNQLTTYRSDTDEWVDPVNVQRFIDGNQIHISIFRSNIRSRRNISLTANILDENNQIIDQMTPIEYEVRGDDDEITLSLDDPNLYIFTIHSSLIGDGGFAEIYGGEVRSLHIAIDSDLNRFTGNDMNDLGADYFLSSWETFGAFIGLDNGDNWDDRWDWYNTEEVHTNVGEHIVEISIPRDYLIAENGIINIGATFNNDEEHFYWTNHYEFNLIQN